MKANEFIKQYGLDKAREVLKTHFAIEKAKEMTLFKTEYAGNTLVISELKTAVEAWELIEKVGGLADAATLINFNGDSPLSFGYITVGDEIITAPEIKAAIQVVQS